MKKLLLLTALFIFACSSDDSSDTNDNNVPDGQYFFEIEIGNEVHRIQGINTEIITNGQNWCSASLLQGTHERSVNKQLETTNSMLGFNNLLTAVQTYQMYKINKNTKSLKK